ncbi:MAG: hypothetical protein J1E62_03345 [Lachnospiraceae bacterium]|nr:hypothetical protein [Lachnospiraceae bacterium]
MKKKILVLAAVLTLSMAVFTGCGSDTNNAVTDSGAREMPNETELPDNADDGAVKDAGDAVNDAVDGAGDAVKDATDGAGDAIKDITDGAEDAVDDTVNGAEKAVDDATGN